MACCGGGSKGEEEESGAEVAADIVGSRSCTDWWCIIVFILHWMIFLVVTLAGVQDGNLHRLYSPRDAQGDYCGVEESYRASGPNLNDHEKLVYLMNVSAAADVIAKELMCSTIIEEALSTSTFGADAELMEEYMCGCCKSPCRECAAVFDIGNLDDQSTSWTADSVASTIAGRITELSDPSQALNLFSTTGLNSGAFMSIFGSTGYFIKSCVSDCSAPDLLTTTAREYLRNYTYEPVPDSSIRKAWRFLRSNDTRAEYAGVRTVLSESFTFAALPSSACPYDPSHCVPWPGIQFEEVQLGYCSFNLASDVSSALGSITNTLGVIDVTNQAKTSFGTAMGDVIESMDAIATAGACALVFAVLFLSLMRFFVRIVTYVAIICIFIIFLGGGTACWVRSSQCNGVGMIAYGESYYNYYSDQAQALVDSGETAYNATDESLTGDGADYRGAQTRTRTGKVCQAWAAQSPHTHSTTASAYPNADLRENYCRNPSGAIYIWCYTLDSNTRWELCSPIGVDPLDAVCPDGYVIESEDIRLALQIFAGVFFALAGIWLLGICCFWKSINMAIAIIEIASTFLVSNAHVVVVPVIQAFIGIGWCMAWATSAAFLVSQVTEGSVPEDFYATYAEAYGTEDTPGKCTDTWPAGEVWKYWGNSAVADDPCSGNMGDTTGITPKCWACYPPRYSFDERFAYSFFSFLWNIFFLLALGQCIIAGAVAVWAFNPTCQKRRPLTQSVFNVFRYHLGSLAFGSFIIAVVVFIRFWLMYLEKQAAAQKNRIMVYILKVVQCCVYCLEKCLKFITKQAYIEIAIVGASFCQACRLAFEILGRNMIRFGILTTLGWVIDWLGIMAITTSTCLVGYLIQIAMNPNTEPVVPGIIMLFIGYVTARLFMNVYRLAMDALLHCVDTAEQKGTKGVLCPAASKLEQYAQGHEDREKSEDREKNEDVASNEQRATKIEAREGTE